MKTVENEIHSGKRFGFGKNWTSYSELISEERIAVAEDSLKEMLGVNDLKGVRFLDIGSGSGLFSLAAYRLGAKVVSFDYDPLSVGCVNSLKEKYCTEVSDWDTMEGSVLDPEFMKELGSFDVVYSWGVLHHTGQMWQAIENAADRVNDSGMFFIALYNDQGAKSRMWTRVKKIYCSGVFGKSITSALFIPYAFSTAVLRSIIKRKNLFADYKDKRGMSITHDWFDWLGGYPFEVASVDEVVQYCLTRSLVLKKVKTVNSHGNNQLVFRRLTGHCLKELEASERA